MIKLKRIISLLLSIFIIVVICLNSDVLIDRIKDITSVHPKLVIKPGNDFVKDDKYNLVSQVDEYIPYNYIDLKNIFYSVLNQGWEEFTFYCPPEYTDCLNDVANLSYNEVLLSDINNYVHPYNSYSTIKTLYDDTGEVTIIVNHLYSKSEIDMIDNEINDIMKSNITADMSDYSKIKVLHDYIINNTKYDVKRANENDTTYDSARILGVLYDHYSICSGYTDLMAVMLDKLDIPNFKVASDTHIWNAVKLDDKWYHLDLTWDDPVTASGKDVLDDTYFLITDLELTELDKGVKDHLFDKNIYSEFMN